jgi:hypothetical protein
MRIARGWARKNSFETGILKWDAPVIQAHTGPHEVAASCFLEVDFEFLEVKKLCKNAINETRFEAMD